MCFFVLCTVVLSLISLSLSLCYSLCLSVSLYTHSILSATDPVAVSALLEAVGAPPRLKVHIAGESLLNDGSAIVFFTIFGLQLYLHELDEERLQQEDEEDLGQEIDWPEGIKIFFRMSLGAVAIGSFFALGSLTLFALLDRRLNREENVVEVVVAITTAYLCYFVAEIAWGTSGVIATVTLGVLVNAFGKAMVNDAKLAEDFGSLVEHMLNTVLFTLGGLVWGNVISNVDEEGLGRDFTGRDWVRV